jgi:hypothetical protein
MQSLVKCTVDTFDNQDAPSTNYGNTVKLWVNGQTSHKKYALIFFTRPFPLGATITSAILKLTLAESWPSGPHTITAKRITATWQESKNTFNVLPATTATNQATTAVTGGAANQQVTLDVTNMISDVSSGGAWNGIRLEIDTTGDKKFWSGDSVLPTTVGGLAPQLAITWTLGPEAPSGLVPTDGAFFDPAQPVVGWVFKDSDGTATQSQSQVQFNLTTNSFTSPTYDSGMVANTQQVFTIAHTFANNDFGYWRVRVQDSGGLTSPWSDPVSFTRNTKGTSALISPAADTKSTLTTSLAGANNDLVFTSLLNGVDGNAITVNYTDPGGTTATLSVAVTGTAIVVSLGRAASAINTTGTLLAAAIAASPAASALVSVANAGGNSGAGLVTAMATTPLAGGINSFVQETTPPISWSALSGQTQSAYRIVVTDMFGVITGKRSHIAFIGPVVLWDSGRVASTATSVNIPNANALANINTSHAFRVDVYLWDTNDRIDQPGSTTHILLSQVFDCNDSATPAAVSTLTATGSGAGPLLTWTIAVQPNFFTIKKDGVIAVDNINPGDVFVSGTTYAYRFLYAEPGQSHTYEVVAKDLNGGVLQLSKSNPTASFTADPMGSWLIDTVTGTTVVILDVRNQRPTKEDWVIGEDATDYYPQGRQDPVHITSSLRGFEGTIYGEIQDIDVGDGNGLVTATTYRKNLETLKGGLGVNEIRFINGSINIPVQLGAIVIAPVHPRGYYIQVFFQQVADFSIHPPSF